MISSAFEIGESLELKKIPYSLHQPMWKYYTNRRIDLDFDKWAEVKYLNGKGNALHPDVETIPHKSGGLYLFYIKCPVVRGITEFPVYIGRAQYTNTQNLKKRCKEYFHKYSNTNERPMITRMFKYWGKELYLAYIPLKNNRTINNLEKQLINSLRLPFNDIIPEQIIRQAKKAFQ